MTKQEIVVELLKERKRLVEEHRRNFEYGEWSCGQQDADAEEAEHYDKVMNTAIQMASSKDIGQRLDSNDLIEARLLIGEVLDDFRLAVIHTYGL